MAGTFRGHTFNALMQPNAVDDRPLAFRSTLAPFGTYANPDGSESFGFAWPAAVTEPINALQRLAQNSYTEDGRLGIPNPQHPENLQDASTLLWSIYGGNALNPAAAIPKNAVGMPAGRIAKTADHNALAKAEQMAAEEANRGKSSVPQGASFHGYRGVASPDHLIPDRDMQPARSSGAFWGTSSPNIADSYASLDGKMDLQTAPSIAPVDFNFSNPLVVDAKGRSWANVPLGEKSASTDVLARIARRRGHDGLVVKNVMDDSGYYWGSPELSDTIAALKRGTVTSPLTGETLFSDTGRPSLAGAAVAAENAPTTGITAYHGSPHDFNRFDLSKIGTGEGAQAYGHGLYFAENEGVANSYRRKLSQGYSDGIGMAREALMLTGGDFEKAIAHVLRGKDSYGKRWGNDPNRLPFGKLYDDAVRELRLKPEGLAPSGHMYQVKINASPEDFLDWDLPLSQQSEKVRDTVLSMVPENDRYPNSLQGKDAVLSLQASQPGKFLDRSEVSPMLREAGIPGIKYLDQMSRTAGDGSRNYVVFDDSLIEILKKYGLAGGAVGTGSLFDFNTDTQY